MAAAQEVGMVAEMEAEAVDCKVEEVMVVEVEAT